MLYIKSDSMMDLPFRPHKVVWQISVIALDVYITILQLTLKAYKLQIGYT